jgi:hypothetical protein
VLASVGDERTSLLLLTVRAAFGPGGAPATVPGARLARFDEDQKLKQEQVIFFVVPD